MLLATGAFFVRSYYQAQFVSEKLGRLTRLCEAEGRVQALTLKVITVEVTQQRDKAMSELNRCIEFTRMGCRIIQPKIIEVYE